MGLGQPQHTRPAAWMLKALDGVQVEGVSNHLSAPDRGFVWQLTHAQRTEPYCRACYTSHKRDFYQRDHLSLP